MFLLLCVLILWAVMGIDFRLDLKVFSSLSESMIFKCFSPLFLKTYRTFYIAKYKGTITIVLLYLLSLFSLKRIFPFRLVFRTVDAALCRKPGNFYSPTFPGLSYILTEVDLGQ